MRVKDVFLFTVLVLVLSFMGLAGCGNDDGADYEGVGKLVAERNRARMARHAQKQRAADPGTSAPVVIKERTRPVEPLVGEEVKVVSQSSGKVLATGTAYFDGDGNIATIRIRKE
jgi:hypothetical protein